jgi:Protein of unknown function (DUF3551)
VRFSLLLLIAAIAGSTGASAEPYRWCSNYGSEGGAISCSFVTLQQCQAAVSGVGGFCVPNSWAVTSPASAPRKRHPSYYRSR